MRQGHNVAAVIEKTVGVDRFSMKALFQSIAQDAGVDLSSEYKHLENSLGRKTTNHILQSLVRSSFLIELVKTPKIETTKFEVRWVDRLGVDDPRYATYETGLDIFEKALHDLETVINSEANRELLRLFQSSRQVAYEIPFDYLERTTDGYIHRPENMGWYFDELPVRVVKLRHFLRNPKVNPYSDLFRSAYDKIQVKTYLTDRVLTGAHKTNREKRWETHPNSVHFALRRTCQEIEYTLINQLCHFEGFPNDLTELLENEGVLAPLDRPFRCPITMDPLSFADFEAEVLDPTHGKANFQVGHLNPLKAINDDPQSGHTSQNISWISSNGNRIQGDLSLDETRAMIRRIYSNYEQFGVK